MLDAAELKDITAPKRYTLLLWLIQRAQIQARDDLARIHLAEVAYDVREPLSRLEARLPHNRFLRVHRSTIVNTAQVREAQPFDQGDQLLILRNGKRITTGRSYRKAVQEFLKRAT